MTDDHQTRESGRINLGSGQESYDNRPATRSNADSVDGNRPVIVGALYLASFITGITGIIGVVLAHMWRGDARGTWAESHYTYLIRTFWFGLLGSIIGGLLTLVLIGFFVLLAVAIWFGVRSVLSLVKASRQEPMPDPDTLWF